MPLLCHHRVSSLWNHKPKWTFLSITCLGHGIYQGNGKVTKMKAKVNTQQLGHGVRRWMSGQIALKIMCGTHLEWLGSGRENISLLIEPCQLDNESNHKSIFTVISVENVPFKMCLSLELERWLSCESVHCSFWRPEFGTQCPHWAAHNLMRLQPQRIWCLWPLQSSVHVHRHVHTHTYPHMPTHN